MDNLAEKQLTLSERIDLFRQKRSEQAKKASAESHRIKRLAKQQRINEDKEALKQEAIELGITDKFLLERPKKRSECVGAIRPCPWVSCKYHLMLDINPKTGHINMRHYDIDDMRETCVLDVVDNCINKGSNLQLEDKDLECVGSFLNMTREAARQIEVSAFKKLSKKENLKNILKEFIEMREDNTDRFFNNPRRALQL